MLFISIDGSPTGGEVVEEGGVLIFLTIIIPPAFKARRIKEKIIPTLV